MCTYGLALWHAPQILKHKLVVSFCIYWGYGEWWSVGDFAVFPKTVNFLRLRLWFLLSITDNPVCLVLLRNSRFATLPYVHRNWGSIELSVRPSRRWAEKPPSGWSCGGSRLEPPWTKARRIINFCIPWTFVCLRFCPIHFKCADFSLIWLRTFQLYTLDPAFMQLCMKIQNKYVCPQLICNLCVHNALAQIISLSIHNIYIYIFSVHRAPNP